MQRFLSVRFLLPQALLLAVFVTSFFALQTDIAYACEATDIPCQFGQGLLSIIGKGIATVMIFITSIFAVVLGWVGSIFNYAMLLTVFQFGNYFGNSEGVLLAWGILRDLANIVVLFGFIYIGFMTILDMGSYTAQKALPTLLIFAALLNFSLFAAEAVVDVANAVAANFYAQIGNIDCGAGENRIECANNGIIMHIFHAAGIASVLSPDNFQSYARAWETPDGLQAATIWFGVFIFMIVLMGVLFVGTIMLVSRAVHLVLLFVISPIGFAGFALPFLGDFSRTKWWGPLINNALFAPAFVLLILISLKIVEAVRNAIAPDVSLIDALSSSDVSALSVLFIFALTIVFLWYSMDMATKFGVYGANQVVGGAKKWIGNTAGGITLAPVNWGSRLAGNLYNATTGGVRRIPLVGSAVTFLGTATGVDSAIRGGLKAGMGLKAPFQEKTLREAGIERKKRADEIEAVGDFQKALGKAYSGDTIALKKIVSGMGNDALVAEVERLTPTSAKILAGSMSAKQFKAVMDAPKIGTDKKTEMREARYKPMKSDIQAAEDVSDPEKQQKAVKKLQKEWDAEDFELSKLEENPQLEAQAVRHMKKEQFDSYLKTLNDKRSQERVKNIREGTDGEGRFSPKHAGAVLNGMTSEDFQHVLTETPKVLTKPHVANALRPAQLNRIRVSGKDLGDPTALAIIQNRVRAMFTSGDADLAAYLHSLNNSQPKAYREFKRFYGLTTGHTSMP